MSRLDPQLLDKISNDETRKHLTIRRGVDLGTLSEKTFETRAIKAFKNNKTIECVNFEDCNEDDTQFVLSILKHVKSITKLGIHHSSHVSVVKLLEHLPKHIETVEIHNTNEDCLQAVLAALQKKEIEVNIICDETIDESWRRKFKPYAPKSKDAGPVSAGSKRLAESAKSIVQATYKAKKLAAPDDEHSTGYASKVEKNEEYDRRISAAYAEADLDEEDQTAVRTAVRKIDPRTKQSYLCVKDVVFIQPSGIGTLEQQYQDSLNLADYIRKRCGLRQASSLGNILAQPITSDAKWEEEKNNYKVFHNGEYRLVPTIPPFMKGQPIVAVRGNTIYTVEERCVTATTDKSEPANPVNPKDTGLKRKSAATTDDASHASTSAPKQLRVAGDAVSAEQREPQGVVTPPVAPAPAVAATPKLLAPQGAASMFSPSPASVSAPPPSPAPSPIPPPAAAQQAKTTSEVKARFLFEAAKRAALQKAILEEKRKLEQYSSEKNEYAEILKQNDELKANEEEERRLQAEEAEVEAIIAAEKELDSAQSTPRPSK